MTAVRRGMIERHARWMTRVALASLVVTALLVGAGSVQVWRAVTEWDPLGDYPPQILLDESGSSPIGVPTYYLTDHITVRALKCAKEPVTIRGSMSWVLEDPAGTILPISEATAKRTAGCAQVTYSNPIPPSVLDRVAELTEAGITQSRWHMSGVETPQRTDGETGEPRSWITASFVLVHEPRPVP